MKNQEEKNIFFQNRLVRRNLKVSLFLICLSILLIVFKFGSIPPKVPFFYSLPWGEKQLASKFFLFFLPCFSLLVLLLNTILAERLKEDFLTAKLLLTGALLFTILAIITLVKIIFLIT